MVLCVNPIWSIIERVDGCNKVHIYRSKENCEKQFLNYLYDNVDVDIVPLSCGKCEECSKSRALEWSYRLYHESQFYKDTCFITLTYKDDPVYLNKKHFQDFIKRLRKHILPAQIKFFGCGEYGSKRGRPHYHAVIFGWKPKDLKFLMMDKNHFKIFNSVELAELWKHGFVSVGECTMNSFKYVCNYMQKQNKYKWHTDDLFDNAPPFVLMSKGLGKRWFLDHIQTLSTDKVFHKDDFRSIPRYYLKVAEKLGYDLTELKNKRIIKVKIDPLRLCQSNLGGVYEKCE